MSTALFAEVYRNSPLLIRRLSQDVLQEMILHFADDAVDVSGGDAPVLLPRPQGAVLAARTQQPLFVFVSGQPAPGKLPAEAREQPRSEGGLKTCRGCWHCAMTTTRGAQLTRQSTSQLLDTP